MGQLSPLYPGKQLQFWADPHREDKLLCQSVPPPSLWLPHGLGGSPSDVSPVTAVFPGEGARESPDDSHGESGDMSLSHRSQRPQRPAARVTLNREGRCLGTHWSPRCSHSPGDGVAMGPAVPCGTHPCHCPRGRCDTAGTPLQCGGHSAGVLPGGSQEPSMGQRCTAGGPGHPQCPDTPRACVPPGLGCPQRSCHPPGVWPPQGL